MPTSRLGERADLYVRWTRGRWPLEQIFPLRGLKKAGLTHDKFMFAPRPRPLTPALSPKGRGSNTGQFAVACFEVMHCGSLSPGGGRVGVRGLPKITPISVKAAPWPLPSPEPARPLPATRLAMRKAGLTHDKFMFARRPRPLTPALSPKGRASKPGQLAVARFGVTH